MREAEDKGQYQEYPRTAFLIYSLGGGGAERVVAHLLKHLLHRTEELHLVLMNQTMRYEIPDGVQVHYIENSNPKEASLLKLAKIPFLAWKYRKLLKRLKIERSVSFLTRPNYINALAGLGLNSKIILSERSYPSEIYKGNSISSIVNRTMIRLCYPLADLTIGNSFGNANDLITAFQLDASKVITIQNPLDLAQLDATEPVEGEFDPNFINLISVGRLEPVKNQQLLLHSIASLQNPKVRLTIYGEGPLHEQLQTLIYSLGLENQVMLKGFSSQIHSCMKAADLFVFSSLFEGFPNALSEALGCGLPAISSNCLSGPAEIMGLNWDASREKIHELPAGFLIPLNDAEAMTQCIRKLTSDLTALKKAGKEARKLASQFDKVKILDRYESAIERLV